MENQKDERVIKIKEELVKELSEVFNANDLAVLKAKYLGKSGLLNDITKNMRDLTPDERVNVGKYATLVRELVTSLFDSKMLSLEEELLNNKLMKETIDITLPSKKIIRGTKHPMSIVGEKIEDLFVSMGYDVVSGPELETDEYCFERLNLPKNHPARDMQDSFYIDEEHLLRTQTSSVQARYMMSNDKKEPIRIIVPGKTFRRDDDASHSPQFSQIEGLVVDKKDKNVSLADLKGTLEIFAKTMIGPDSTLRFRPSYFPFTEPSYEVDVSCFNCGGRGCSLCKQTGWIEVFAAGMVHPNVLRDNGYDPSVWGGFAFGPGWDRITMFRYGIPDIRYLYTNDIRFLKQFDKEEE